MSIYRGPYEPAQGCGGTSAGALALQSWWTGAYPGQAVNLGTCNCRRIGGTTTWSLHAECRAADMGTAPYGAPPGGSWPDWMWAAMDALRLHSHELQIQLIIFRRRVWSCTQPDAGWRAYGGSNPHNGHGHVELTRLGARTLTVDRINQEMGGGGGMMPLPRHGDRGEHVEFWQQLLAESGQQLPRFGADGHYGDETQSAVSASRASFSSTVDPDIKRITPWHAAKLTTGGGGGAGPRGLAGPPGPPGKIPAEITVSGKLKVST